MKDIKNVGIASRLMILYALALLAGGATAYLLAPAGANAMTALIIPGVCAALMIGCALMARAIDRNKAVGMTGIHLGLVLPLVFAVAFGMRAYQTGEAVRAYRESAARPPAAVASPADPTIPDHDKTYLRNTLWALTGLSVLAFGALLLARPTPARRGIGQAVR